MTSGMHGPHVENTIKQLCDGVIELRVRERQREVERSILIRKMHGMIAPNETITYNVTTKGIVLDNTRRVL
ncbi:MAG: ATPase domain-containing protein [Euryarchaeota archaeon]|nr:ATPase domain-containing protein [Euryarchaeota archaeon]